MTVGCIPDLPRSFFSVQLSYVVREQPRQHKLLVWQTMINLCHNLVPLSIPAGSTPKYTRKQNDKLHTYFL